MSSSPKIIVFGASGTIGFEVAKALASQGVPFKAVVHSIEKADKLKRLGSSVEVIQVDLYNPDSIAKALVGIEKVFMALPPGQTNTGFTLTDAIKKAGTVKHVVKLSAIGSETTGGQFVLGEEHRQVDNYITAAGIPLTSINPTCFHSNLLMDIPTIKSSGAIYNPFGETKLNFINPEDVGLVSAKALTEGETHYGKFYNLTGPDNVSYGEITQLLNKATGKDIKYVKITLEDLRKKVATFLPPQTVEPFVNMYKFFADGGCDRNEPDLQTLLGRPGKPFSVYIEENKAAFV